MRIHKRLEPISSRVILDLNDMRERCASVLESEELERGGVGVEGSGERLFGGADCVFEGDGRGGGWDCA